MNEFPLLKLCHLEFNLLFYTFFILICFGGLNVVELLVLNLWTKSELFNKIELLLAQYLLK